jgi:HK97 family phage portal protein
MGALSEILRGAFDIGSQRLTRMWSFSSGSTFGGKNVDPDTALRTSAVWRCFKVLSGTTAMLPLKVYQTMPDESRRPAKEHSTYKILHRRFSRWQTSFKARQMLMGHRLLRGNAYAEIIRDAYANPVELVPRHPDRMVGLVDASGDLVGWEYTQVVNGLPTQPRRIWRGDVLHLTGPSLDGFLGLNTTYHAKEAIGLAMSAEEYGARIFNSGGARRGALLNKGPAMSPEAEAKLREHWRETYGGSGANAARVAVLEDGLEWVNIGITPEEAQQIALRTYQVAEICRFFDVPLWLAFETTKDTAWGSGLEQTNLAFLTYSLQQSLVDIEQTIMNALFTEEELDAGYYVEHQVEGLLRGDSAARSAWYRTMREIGLYSRDDIARKENEPLIGGKEGNERCRPGNWVPLGSEVDPAAAKTTGETR